MGSPGGDLCRHELLVRPDVLDDNDRCDVPRANHTYGAAKGDRRPSACCLPALQRVSPQPLQLHIPPAQPRPPQSFPSGSSSRGNMPGTATHCPQRDANAIPLHSGAIPCRCEWQTWDGLSFGQEKEASVKEVTLLGSPGPAPAARLHQDTWWGRAGLQTTRPGDPYWLCFLLDGQPQRQGTTHLKAALPTSSSKPKGGTQAMEYNTGRTVLSSSSASQRGKPRHRKEEEMMSNSSGASGQLWC